MAYYKDVIDQSSQKEFDTPPVLDYQLRKHFFSLPPWAENIVSGLSSSVNKVGFILQLGYFKATGRFFKPITFRKGDISFITQRILQVGSVQIRDYADATRRRHQEEILRQCHVLPFTGEARLLCEQEALQLVSHLQKRQLVFAALASFIREHRIQLPSYTTFAIIINQAYSILRNNLLTVVDQQLTPQLRKSLDELLEKQADLQQETTKTSPYRLTRLKNNPELIRQKAVRENVVHFLYLKKLYLVILPILNLLTIGDNLVEEYARYVKRSHSYQVKEWNDRYLLLICFVKSEYFHLTDLLTETFRTLVEQNINQCEKAYKEERLLTHERSLTQLDTILASYLSTGKSIQLLQDILFNFTLTETEKLAHFSHILQNPETSSFLASLPQVLELYQQTKGQIKNEDYYQHITQGSQRLQLKVSDLVRHLQWEAAQSETHLLEAVEFFQKSNGQITAKAPTGFLKSSERKAVIDQEGKIKVSLYKSLLFRHLHRALRAGFITLPHSHLHKSINNYLIPFQEWQSNKQTLLQRANLRTMECWPTVKQDLQTQLAAQYEHTFSRISNGENLWVVKRKDDTLRFRIPTQKQEKEEVDLYPKDRLISIYEALVTINRSCHFLKDFRSYKPDSEKSTLNERLVMAAIIAYGCNLSLSRIAKSSKDINQSSLETMVNTYFFKENLVKANDHVSALIEKLGISRLFRKQSDKVHTSSDGQKYSVALDSIHANYSYKYFGKEKGVTIYSFINESHNIFSSTVFSAKNKEAWYIFDGLMHNEVVQSDFHSTDTDGATTPIFALSYLLGILFQPRIKGFSKLNFYGLESLSVEDHRQYLIKEGKDINLSLIEKQWDEILRLAVSIKLKYTKPSQVLKRLTSSALQNPLYSALNELGKVIRSLYLLEYMDDENLRQRVDGQLNKIESIHALASAVSYGTNGILPHASLQDLQIADQCKRLVMNVVICWNYLYLTKQLIKASSQERKQLEEAIGHSSTVAWKHFNFQGEFNFIETMPREAFEEELRNLLSYKPE
ncbi:Tn3 family transposase [Cytophagaceae bacterium DM2B3-1]|uniref:Tn3 family transposase n=1 Tax=Xanthocytophaga flava TaxID=3048013 RepID=A0ABT7CX10_9BACT|nr:Tn3 family transposase [Xanthocytophaga flavus]MDJ1498265.1 Tn3 family transposase [Xanthocytophaga flavus]